MSGNGRGADDASWSASDGMIEQCGERAGHTDTTFSPSRITTYTPGWRASGDLDRDRDEEGEGREETPHGIAIGVTLSIKLPMDILGICFRLQWRRRAKSLRVQGPGRITSGLRK